MIEISFDVTAIIVSAFICFSLAALWLSPALFGNVWLRQLEKNGLTAHELNDLKTFAYVFIFLILFATVVNIIIDNGNISGMRKGIEVGFVIWLLISLAHASIHFVFERRTVILFGIYSSYYLASSVIISTLLSMRR